MKTISTLLILITLFSCYNNTSAQFSKNEIDEIRNNYVNGWLTGNSEKILGLFGEEAVIIPSGMTPIQGIDSIEKYWFPNDGSITTIHSYEVDLIELSGNDSMAYSLEKGVLNFTYTKGEFTMTKESTSHATTVYQKDAEGWKIISRMWTQQK